MHQEKRVGKEQGPRRVILSDNQRTILTNFERVSKELGGLEHQPANTAPGLVTEARTRFNKARADVWGMVTTMKKALTEASRQPSSASRTEKTTIRVYDHPDHSSAGVIQIETDRKVVEISCLTMTEAERKSKELAELMGLKVVETGNLLEKEFARYEGNVAVK
jgi:hypothetical protein